MDLLRTIEGMRTPFWDTFFGLITRLGEEMILIVFFCVLYWCINKKMAYVMGAVFFMSSLVVQGMKLIFRVPRPWVYDPTFTTVEGSVGAATGYAFPSGHTQNAAAWLGSLGAQIKPLYIKIICFTLAILVAFSRMYLGVHYLSDVVASLVITFAILFIAMKVIASESVCKTRELLISGFIALCAIATIIFAVILYHNGTTEASQLRDSTRGAGAAIGFAIGMFVERVYIRFSVKSKSILWHIIKVVLGIGGTLAIQEGVRFIGTGLVIDAVRYFLMVTWITLAYPLIIKRFFAITEPE